MPAAFALVSLSSASAFVVIDARTMVKALLPGGQPVDASVGAGVGAGVAVPPVAPLSAGAGGAVELAGAGVGVDAVGGVSAGAACDGAAAGLVGAAAVVLLASPVTPASAIA